MIILIASLGVLTALAAFAGVLVLIQPHGRHEAGPLAERETYPRTEPPRPVPAALCPVRIVARRITPAEMVKRYYEAAEYEMLAQLNALSRYHAEIRELYYA